MDHKLIMCAARLMNVNNKDKNSHLGYKVIHLYQGLIPLYNRLSDNNHAEHSFYVFLPGNIWPLGMRKLGSWYTIKFNIYIYIYIYLHILLAIVLPSVVCTCHLSCVDSALIAALHINKSLIDTLCLDMKLIKLAKS